MGQVEDAIAFAKGQIGKPYKFGTKGPNTFDCSGLIVAAYKAANPPIHLPHWTGALIGIGKSVLRSELQPGDLIFPDSGHVQLYIGNNQMIEAQQDGVPVRQGALWGFWQARRVVGESLPGKLATTAAGILTELPGPFSAGADLKDVLRPVGAVAFNVANPHWWARIGMGATGVFLMITGVFYWNRRPIMQAASSVTGAVQSVGSTLIQGAAFGFGAGKASPSKVSIGSGPASGVPAAPTTSSPARIPKAPPAVAPVTAPASRSDDPVTSFVMGGDATFSAPQSPGGTYTVTKFRGTAKRPPTKVPSRDAPGSGPFFIGGKRGKK